MWKATPISLNVAALSPGPGGQRFGGYCGSLAVTELEVNERRAGGALQLAGGVMTAVGVMVVVMFSGNGMEAINGLGLQTQARSARVCSENTQSYIRGG